MYVHQSTSLLSGLFSATLGLQKVGRPGPQREEKKEGRDISRTGTAKS